MELVRQTIGALEPIFATLDGLDDESRFHAASELNGTMLDAQARLAATRRSAVRSLREKGYTLAELGEMLGMSTGRVHQIEQGYGRKEKAARAARTVS